MRLLPSMEGSVAQQLVWDSELLANGSEVLRFWEAHTPTVVLGKANLAADWVHEARCRADAVPVLRRESGGGSVVLSPGCLNYSAVFSLDQRPAWRNVQISLEAILRPLAAALSAEFRPPGDLAIGDRKIAGCAQRRTMSALLHHGTILYAFDTSLAERYLCLPNRQPAYRNGRSHLDFLANLAQTRKSLEQCVAAAWKDAFGIESIR